MKLVCLSDTHNQIDKVKIPSGDLLIVAGDFTIYGSMEEYIKFNNDLAPIKPLFKFGILVINGNHDFLSEKDFNLSKTLLTNVSYYLQHETVKINNINFFGSAYTPRFFDYAWNVDRGPAIKAKWDLIPNDTDVLITHGPPMGKRDLVIRKDHDYTSACMPMRKKYENVGCADLLKAIKDKNIGLHVFGHIHAGYGIDKDENTIYINASTCNEKYKPVNPPIIIDIDKNKPVSEWKPEYFKPVVNK